MPDKRFLKKLEKATDQIIAGYENGQTLSEIAKFHGCATGTVRNLLESHGVKRRKRGPRLKVMP